MCVINKNERNGHLFFAAVQGLILFSFNVIIRPVLRKGAIKGVGTQGSPLGWTNPESLKHAPSSTKREITLQDPFLSRCCCRGNGPGYWCLRA